MKFFHFCINTYKIIFIRKNLKNIIRKLLRYFNTVLNISKKFLIYCRDFKLEIIIFFLLNIKYYKMNYVHILVIMTFELLCLVCCLYYSVNYYIILLLFYYLLLLIPRLLLLCLVVAIGTNFIKFQ